MTDPKEFTYKKKADGEWTRFELAGPVTEYASATLRKLAVETAPKSILDLKGVTFANSTGIRDWSYMLKDFKDRKTVVFENVPDEIVRTMNMVLGFRQGLQIRSLLRTYFCDHCNHETTLTLTLGRDYQEKKIPAAKQVVCEKCGDKAAPPDAEEDFFMFLTEVA